MNTGQDSKRQVSAADFAARFGVTAKALRVYERHGLLNPARSASDWRLYGAQDARALMCILVLRRLGVPLARMKSLISGRETLDGMLALREAGLEAERGLLEESLAIVGAARAALARGRDLSVEDLARLGQGLADRCYSWTGAFENLAQRHFTPAQVEILRRRHRSTSPALRAEWTLILADAERLCGGDPGSDDARDLVFRWFRLVARATGGDRDIHNASYAMYSTVAAAADPAASEHLPGSKPIWDFIHAVVARMRADGEHERLLRAARGEDQ